ncbi:PREDICTED: multiple C2 and transmembrane domain-containing protein 1-like [Nanorana parkeri]|uniref:multiple C2 and transmembrane domain-containing protein 1-like n=1 Tax=Nanorana parkeri TaxID=125878 RepID=UPI00085492B1|nr:PREDICTED: multiple C2 and transmembrane domain-containing protein 1-like [Nanorana parkeri]
MEPAGSDTPGYSLQARLFKNLQLGRSRKIGKPGAERRSAGTPCPSPPPHRRKDPEGTMEEVVPGIIRWSGIRRRKQVLDRVFSSSQPNLCCSGADPLPSSTPCSSPGSIAGTPEPGSTLRRLRDHLLPYNRAGHIKEKDGEVQPGNTSTAPARAHQLSHQKSSSLPGTEFIEKMLQSSSTKDSGTAKPRGSCQIRDGKEILISSNTYLSPCSPAADALLCSPTSRDVDRPSWSCIVHDDIGNLALEER